METPLVSVIIPCYNCEKFLRPALNSIINQTYRNLEIIIINDGSTDKTVEIIKEFQKFDQRIVFIDNIQNKGLIFTLNKGIVCSQGKYIARMDSDDISLENRIEQQVNYMENNPDISVCGTNSYIIDEDDNIKGKSKLPISVSENFQFMAYSSTIYHPTVLMRSDIIKKEFYNNDFIHAEDYELWCRLLYKKNEKIVNLPEYLFKYRKVSTSVSSTNTDTQWKTSAKIFDNYNCELVVVCCHKKRGKDMSKEFIEEKSHYYKTAIIWYTKANLQQCNTKYNAGAEIDIINDIQAKVLFEEILLQI